MLFRSEVTDSCLSAFSSSFSSSSSTTSGVVLDLKSENTLKNVYGWLLGEHGDEGDDDSECTPVLEMSSPVDDGVFTGFESFR